MLWPILAEICPWSLTDSGNMCRSSTPAYVPDWLIIPNMLKDLTSDEGFENEEANELIT